MSALDLTRNDARLAFATTAVVAMTYQFAVLNVEPGYAKGNFFSFFTIQSNILAVAALCLLVLVPRASRTPLFDAVRSGIVLYMATTGVVFALLLSGLQEELQTATSWADFVVHRLMPIVLVLDWLLDPPRHRLLWCGYGRVLLNATVLTACFAVAALALVGLGNRLGARRAAPT
ncbi:MAG TPA: Pr6Pr family membrane protein [Gaiellaceae bacterium]|nr:Pr6Pr family membrane protein [Gaiellaceae bacterium]